METIKKYIYLLSALMCLMCFSGCGSSLLSPQKNREILDSLKAVIVSRSDTVATPEEYGLLGKCIWTLKADDIPHHSALSDTYETFRSGLIIQEQEFVFFFPGCNFQNRLNDFLNKNDNLCVVEKSFATKSDFFSRPITGRRVTFKEK